MKPAPTSMSKHQEILDYLGTTIGKRVSVRSISNFLNVSDGTAYRAIEEAEKSRNCRNAS